VQTVLGQREIGHPVMRWYYHSSFAKQYTRGDAHGDRILRTETCCNDTYHFGVRRRLEILPALHDTLADTNQRCLELQAELLASPIDTGQLAALASPTLIGQRRIPGLKLHDDRVIRLLERLLHPGCMGDWTSRELHTRILARHRLAETTYRLSQLRYDLSKLRAKGLVERIGASRRYRLTKRSASNSACSSSNSASACSGRSPHSSRPALFATDPQPTPSMSPFKKLTSHSTTSPLPSDSNKWREQKLHSSRCKEPGRATPAEPPDRRSGTGP
jgi:hypothetical protein